MSQRFVQRFLGVRGLLGLRFDVEFGRSMVNTDLKTRSQGEIRRVCTAPNSRRCRFHIVGITLSIKKKVQLLIC